MRLGVDSCLRKLSFCTVHACTDSSDKALRGSRLCITTAIRVATPVANGYDKGLHHCMAVYCEPWLPSERISTRYLQKPAAKSQSRSNFAARCNSLPREANMRGASVHSAAQPRMKLQQTKLQRLAGSTALPTKSACMYMYKTSVRCRWGPTNRQQGGPPARGRARRREEGGGRGRRGRGARGVLRPGITRALLVAPKAQRKFGALCF